MIWIILLFFATVIWLWSGLYKLEIGWKGSRLFLGKRTREEVEEGWNLAPFPLGIQEVDCHQKTIALDVIEDVVTKDNIAVDISGSLVRDIVDVYTYLGVDQATIKEGLDDIWDERIRVLVGQMNLSDVLRMKDVLTKTARVEIDSHARVNWGVSIIKINISEVKTDEGVKEDLEREEREKLQRRGQEIQAEWSGKLEKYFLGKEPLKPGGALGPSLSAEMAHEMTLYTLELAEKKKVEQKTFGLDKTTSEALATALAAIKGGRP